MDVQGSATWNIKPNKLLFSSSLPSLESIHSAWGLAPRLHHHICGYTTRLELVFLVGPMQPTWSELQALLRALPNLEFIRLAGVSCDTHPGPSHSQTLLFDCLTHLKFLFTHESMVDVLGSIVVPALIHFCLDILHHCPLTHFLDNCTHLLRLTHTLDVKVSADINIEEFIRLYAAISSASTLDFSRSPPNRGTDISYTLMNFCLDLPSTTKIFLPAPVNDVDAQKIIDPLDGDRLAVGCVLITPLLDGSGDVISRCMADGSVTTEPYIVS